MELNIRTTQPVNKEYEYQTRLEVIDLDKERDKGIILGKDFFIKNPQDPKKDVKSDTSIFSSKYGASVLDQNAFKDRYRCKCGHLRGALYNGEECPICHDKVKYVDDDFGIFGWIVLSDKYQVIHPNLYEVLKSFIGSKKLNNILQYSNEANEDGFFEAREINPDSPFDGIGMIDFAKRLDDVLEFYRNKNKSNPKKIELYNHLMKNREKILTHSIPVYTLFLRMVNVIGEQFTFTKNNKWYNNIARNVSIVNNESMDIYRRNKTKNDVLFDIQKSLQEIYTIILNDMRGKKGAIRSVMAGRYNFTARAVITPDATLQIDEIKLPYTALVVLLEQTIINFLVKSLDMSYTDAYKRWFRSQIIKDQFILNIIYNIIKSRPRGIAFIINRNPSISYGSLLQMYCVGINEDDFTMSVPLQILASLGADFDGDCMNIMYIINKQFEERATRVLNPRNAMMISRNDGKFNSAVNHFKDTYVNLNSMVYIGRDSYTQKELDNIKALQKLK